MYQETPSRNGALNSKLSNNDHLKEQVHSRVGPSHSVYHIWLIIDRVLITTPRRSPAAPNPTGSHALYTVSKYSLESHTETKEIRVLYLATGQDTLFSDDQRNKDPSWLIGTQVLWLREADDGSTELWIGTAGEADKKYVRYPAGQIRSLISA